MSDSKQELPPKPYLTEDGNGNKTHYPADMADAYIAALRAELATLSSRCESLREVVKQYREFHMKSRRPCIESATCSTCQEADALLAPKPADTQSGELARERELNQELRQVVKQYREDHREYFMQCVHGDTGRCVICIKADLLLAPKPADTQSDQLS